MAREMLQPAENALVCERQRKAEEQVSAVEDEAAELRRSFVVINGRSQSSTRGRDNEISPRMNDMAAVRGSIR